MEHALEYGCAQETATMNNLLIAAAIAVQFTLPGKQTPAPKPTCNIKTVSYKFTGAPGTEFRYDGSKYVIPADGAIELIASKKATQADFGMNKIELDLFPADEFGTRAIPLTSSTTTKGE